MAKNELPRRTDSVPAKVAVQRRGEEFVQEKLIAQKGLHLMQKQRGRREYWSEGTFNSPIASYDARFARVLEGKPIASLLEGVDVPVVIDLMAPTGTIADLFQKIPQKEKYGIAFALDDVRTDAEKARDKELGIILLTGDLNNPAEWVRLQREVAAFTHNRKANVIMASPEGGLPYLPHHEYFYGFTLRILWEMLSKKGGNLLTETLPDRWLKKLGLLTLEETRGTLQQHGIEAYSNNDDRVIGTSTLRLVRYKGISLDAALQDVDDQILARGK